MSERKQRVLKIKQATMGCQVLGIYKNDIINVLTARILLCY